MAWEGDSGVSNRTGDNPGAYDGRKLSGHLMRSLRGIILVCY
ncbi:hypothetical protein Zm00014a_000991 [Zea mays]|uniref:Uncharacterized protein n=1 Tax=Zea mays TaxID=4577 RepID=A0A3L6EBW5_MAIZE|nr:hypothetical protein Zm00014a_000991 [Zea mays]